MFRTSSPVEAGMELQSKEKAFWWLSLVYSAFLTYLEAGIDPARLHID